MPNSPFRPLQILLFYLMLFWLGTMLLAGNLLALPLIALPRPLRQPPVRLGISLICRVFLAGCAHFGLMRLDLRALDRLNRRHGLLLLPNHPSMIDAFLILSRVEQAVCLMKASIGSNLFLGIGAQLAGYVSNRSAEPMFRSAIACVRRGGILLLFPEGTRTQHPPVNPLQGAAALIAKRAQVPMQTILITTDSPYLSKGWKIWRPPVFPMHYRAAPGPVFQPDENVNAATETLQHYFECAIARADACRQASASSKD